MDKPKTHVGFSEAHRIEGDGGEQVVMPPKIPRIFIPKRTQSVLSHCDSTQGTDTPSPFSPDYPATPGGTSFGPNTRRQGHRKGGKDRDLEMDEPTGDSFREDEEHKWYGQKDKMAPESALTLFAFRIAVLEKIASNLGTMAFLWATVVLLGGFATTAAITDFWVVTVLLFTEGVRIFGRSHELEWQHVACKFTTHVADSAKRATTKEYKLGSSAVHLSSRVVRTTTGSLIHKPDGAEHGVDLHHPEADEKTNAPAVPAPLQKSVSAPTVRTRGPGDDRAMKLLKLAAAKPGGMTTQMNRTWSKKVVPLIPYTRLALFSSQAISLYLYWLQIASALLSIGLSTWRLYLHYFTDAESVVSPGMAADNLVLGLVLFYGLALAEAAIFLIGRGYWELKLTHENLLVKVSDDYHLPSELQEVVKSFFYDVYSKTLNGSLFDGLDMDLVPYALELIQSDTAKLQLQGSQVLTAFVKDPSTAEETLRRIGTTPRMFERLVEMLSWHNENEEEIRTAAAEIVCRLVFFNRNTFRIAGIAGAVEGIVCLLYEQELRGPESLKTYEAGLKLRLLGLRILKYLSKDHNNRAKIGTTRGLLEMLVTLIQVRSESDVDSHESRDHVKCFKKSLQLLSMMASSPGESGKQLRTSILHVISAVRNLRDILQYGSQYPDIQKCAVDLLTYLAMDDDVKTRDSIGSTGGLIRNLVALLLVKKRWTAEETAQPDVHKELINLAVDAGEALNLLALQNSKNCRRMISTIDPETGQRVPTLQHLMELVTDADLGATAAKILRSFSAYACPEDQNQIVTIIPVAFQVLQQQKGKHREAAVGLASKALQVLHQAWKYEDALQDAQPLDRIFTEAGVDKKSFVQDIMLLIPSKTRLPRIRRHAVELMAILMEWDPFFVTEFREAGLDRKLYLMLDTIWDIENFYSFSRNVGLTRHEQDMEDLVWSALSKLTSPTQTGS